MSPTSIRNHTLLLALLLSAAGCDEATESMDSTAAEGQRADIGADSDAVPDSDAMPGSDMGSAADVGGAVDTGQEGEAGEWDIGYCKARPGPLYDPQPGCWLQELSCESGPVEAARIGCAKAFTAMVSGTVYGDRTADEFAAAAQSGAPQWCWNLCTRAEGDVPPEGAGDDPNPLRPGVEAWLPCPPACVDGEAQPASVIVGAFPCSLCAELPEHRATPPSSCGLTFDEAAGEWQLPPSDDSE